MTVVLAGVARIGTEAGQVAAFALGGTLSGSAPAPRANVDVHASLPRRTLLASPLQGLALDGCDTVRSATLVPPAGPSATIRLAAAGVVTLRVALSVPNALTQGSCVGLATTTTVTLTGTAGRAGLSNLPLDGAADLTLQTGAAADMGVHARAAVSVG